MTPIPPSDLNHLFEEISEHTWGSLVVFLGECDTPVAEASIGDLIILEIDNLGEPVPNAGVWTAIHPEDEWPGRDVDVFVETAPGQFVWWALQGHIVQLGGQYEELDTPRGGEYAWTRLNRLSEEAGCISRFLFYNGVEEYSFKGTDCCKKPFREFQWGCSLVKTGDVAKLARARSPRFEDFHPELAQPWRIIVGCPVEVVGEKVTLYSAAQVEEALKNFPKAGGGAEFGLEDFSLGPVNDFPLGAIDEFSSSAYREVGMRMVVRMAKEE